jgi:hypothetical protein
MDQQYERTMRSTLIAVLWLAPSMALAQTATTIEQFGPANPQMKGPPTTYQSPFEKQPSGAEATPWRAANDEAGRLSGHIGQLGESDQPTDHSMHGAANAASSPRMPTHDHK